MNDVLLSEMISTRFCHDLAGPINAVNNGMELLQDEDCDNNDIIELLTLSSKEAMAKLQLYRTAYGKAGKVIQSDVAEFEDIVTRFFANSKIQVHWEAMDGKSRIDNQTRKITAGSILLIAGLLIYGGEILVQKNNREITLIASAKKLKKDQQTVALLDESGDIELTVHNAPIFLLISQIKEAGLKCELTTSETSLNFRVFKK